MSTLEGGTKSAAFPECLLCVCFFAFVSLLGDIQSYKNNALDIIALDCATQKVMQERW